MDVEEEEKWAYSVPEMVTRKSEPQLLESAVDHNFQASVSKWMHWT